MEDISIFCALSRQESFGVAVLEASALGIPVIVSNRGGLPEVVINESTGIIIEKLNPESASKAILKLVRDYEYRKFLGENGREFVNKKYNWNDSLNMIVKTYHTLLIKK